MTKELPLNDGWEYRKEPDTLFLCGGEAETETVRLPHTGTLLPYNYTDERAYQYRAGYRKTLPLPALDGGRRLFVTFDGAAQQSRLLLNGETLLVHACGYTAFTAELTKGIRAGENTLALELESRESLDIPPFGNEIDYLTYQGVYRGCRLTLTGPTFLADVFVRTKANRLTAELTSVGKAAMARVKVTDKDGRTMAVDTQRLTEAASQLRLPAGLPVKPEECSRYTLKLDCPGVRRWTTETPTLYTLTVTLLDEEKQPLDEKTVRFGFREAEFRTDGFYLNGERIQLRGLDRHQSYPYVGYAMPDSVQRRDAEILHDELGLNIVRTSHYPQSQAFLDRCDELGLLVFTEIPGWQHIGGENWKKQALRNVDDMVWQSRNHPSVILWGVRINESQDDDALYRRTNLLARELDPTRQTGGVRYIRKSSFLEDVYTYNDFFHDGTNEGLAEKRLTAPELKTPYLVTEYNGHMYPTKMTDDEPHRLEHALRHARVLNAAYGMENLSGCIGWCAFDYNTHRNFGSGDRICYHGVMDMFRNPKPAAAVYASQRDLAPVLEIAATLNKGDWPASIQNEVWAFTNADSVRVSRDGEALREFLPDRNAFPNLPHPPVRMADFSGKELTAEVGTDAAALLHEVWVAADGGNENTWKTLKRKHGISREKASELYQRFALYQSGMRCYRFEAIRDEKVVAVSVQEAVLKTGLRVDVERNELKEDGMWDALEIRITAVDQNGNRLWYAADPLLLSISGPVELIGPACIPLRGGAAGVWLRSTGEKGEASLTIYGMNDTKKVDISVK